MSTDPPNGTPADEGEPLADVLESGADAPDWRPTPQQRTAAIAVAAAVLVTGAVLVLRQTDEPRQVPAAPVLVLAEGAAVVPRLGAGAPAGQMRVGLHIDVVNASRRAVRLTSAELVPGPWRVAVMDDTDTLVRSERGLPLRPGRNATLVAHRLVDCTVERCGGPAPQSLVLHLDRDGRHEQQSIDVSLGSTAYSGQLYNAFGRPEGVCGGAAAAAPWTPPFRRLGMPSLSVTGAASRGR